MDDLTFKKATMLQEKFNEVRGWEKERQIPVLKDFLLNICEEATEAWSLIKWVEPEKQKEIIANHKDQLEDFMGDSLFLLFKIAWFLDIDAEKSYKDTLKEYEQRFPVEKVKELKHGNPLAGGIDDKENSSR